MQITMPGAASATAQAKLPRALGYAGPLANNPAAVAFTLHDESRITQETGAKVSAVTNLVANGPTFAQGTDAQRPTFVADTDLGRSTLEFDATAGSNLSFSGTYSPHQAFTLVAVFKATTGTTGGTYPFIAGYFNGGSDRAGLLFRPTASDSVSAWNGVAAGAAIAEAAYTSGSWNVAVMSFDGIDTTTISVNGGAPVTNTPASPVLVQPGDNPVLYMGQPSHSSNMKLDALGYFGEDAHGADPAQAQLMADIRAMIEARYPNIITLVPAS